MGESIPCLVRVGDNVKKHKVIKLDREKVTIGRSGDVSYVILSNMISRCHAVLKCQEDASWTITDNKSLNGVYVNGKRLESFKACELKDGDMVQFGVATTTDMPAEFIYKFHLSLKIRFEKKHKKLKVENQALAAPSDSSQFSEAGSEVDEERDKKRKIAKTASDLHEEARKRDEEQLAREADYKARLAEMERLLKEKEEKQSEVEKQLEKEREERERKVQEVAELKEKEQAIRMEMHDKQAQLEKEKDELKRKIQSELETTLKEKELTLRAQLASEKESLMGEKNQVEKNLQSEMAKALEEKDKEVEAQLLKMKEDLELIIHEKDQEQKLLESRLTETREESEEAKLKALKAKDDVVSDFTDLMEMELQCSICNELFIKAVSLNCSHVFCKLCINQWMKVKKECPNCRAAITTQMHAIALDSYIEKMVERLSDDLKSRRKAMVEHRKTEEEKFNIAKPGPSGSAHPAVRPVNVTIASILQRPPVPAVPETTRTSNRIRQRQHGRGRGRGRGIIVRAPAPNVNPGRSSTSAVTAVTIPNVVTVTTSSAPNTRTVTATTAPNTIAAVAIATVTSSTVTTPLVTGPASTSTANNSALTGSSSSSSAADTTSIEISSDEEGSDDSIYNHRYNYRRRYLSSTSNSDEDDEVQVEGVAGTYFGGYGRCFKCGSRGHWANGCPF